MGEKNKALSSLNLLEINLAMLFLGTSGPFGKFIDLPVPLTIAIRALLGLTLLILYCKWREISFDLRRRDIFPILVSGALLGVHWMTYFKALQLSSVAIGMLSLFTYPVMTSFLEPLFLKVKFQKIHLLLGLMVLSGIYLLAPEIDFGNSTTIAICLGLFSAICYAARNIILKTKVDSYQGSILMGYQLAVVCVMLFPVYFMYDLNTVVPEWKGLLGLIVITTVIGHTLFINTFKHFSITTVSILSSIQPVYGIIIGAFLLSEIPSWSTIFGGILILTSVVIESFRSYR